MDKEEILLKDNIRGGIICNSIGTWENIGRTLLDEVDLEDATEANFNTAKEHAKQESIAFAEFLGCNFECKIIEGIKMWKPYSEAQMFSTDAAYKLYQQSKNKQL